MFRNRSGSRITSMTYPDGTVVKNPVFIRSTVGKKIIPVVRFLGVTKFVPSSKD